MKLVYLMKKINRTELHDRNIFLRGFLRDDNLYDIEAELIDTKHYIVPNQDRGDIQPGEPIHNMKIIITLDKDMVIKDADALTIFSPFNICKHANKNFKKIIGLQIKSGWRSQALKKIGNINGCTHISELLTPIATTAFQTIKGHEAEVNRKNKNLNTPSRQKPSLLGTCYAFNPKSEVVKRFWPEWHEN